jgi:hypothetical protein
MLRLDIHIDALGFEIPCVDEVVKVEEGTAIISSRVSPTPSKKKPDHGSGSSTHTKHL